jgi:hypothetical protein
MTTTERLHQLFVLNLVLQLFDGVATYYGQRFWGEGNPLVASLIPYYGLGLTLLLMKAKACGCLFLLRRLEGRPLVAESLAGIATVYACFSFLPWMTRFVSLLVA